MDVCTAKSSGGPILNSSCRKIYEFNAYFKFIYGYYPGPKQCWAGQLVIILCHLFAFLITYIIYLKSRK